MSLLALPVEMLCEISEHISSVEDLNAFMWINRQFYQLFNQYLYQYDREYCGSSALLKAATSGNMATLERYFEEQREIMDMTKVQAAMQLAVENSRHSAAVYLIEKGANVNAEIEYFSTLLQLSAWLGDGEMLKLLIDQGADINVQGGHYGSALQAAAWAGTERMVQLLLQNGADVNAQGGYFGNALQGASWAGKKDVVVLLLSQGAPVDALAGFYGTALQAASVRGRTEVVQILLNHGADANIQGGHYSTACMAASAGGHWRVEGLLRYWAWRQRHQDILQTISLLCIDLQNLCI
jgi:hypothetical protein